MVILPSHSFSLNSDVSLSIIYINSINNEFHWANNDLNLPDNITELVAELNRECSFGSLNRMDSLKQGSLLVDISNYTSEIQWVIINKKELESQQAGLVAYSIIKLGLKMFKDNGFKQFLKSQQMTLLPNILSLREIQVFKQICKGNSTAIIASNLFLSHNTIKSHKQNIAIKFNSSKSTRLVAIGSAMGIF